MQKSKRKRETPQTPDNEELNLASSLFGGKDIEFGKEDTIPKDIFTEDRIGDLVVDEPSAEAEKPAWEDQDDDAVRVDVSSAPRLRKLRRNEEEKTITGRDYTNRLRERFELLTPATDWAKAVPSPSEILANSGSLLKTEKKFVQTNLLVERLKDANVAEPSQAVIRSAEFHPNGQFMLTAGQDKALRFFQIDGVRNPKVQVVHFADMPIHRARFASNGSEVIVTGRRPHFYSFDLNSSKSTRIPRIKGRDENSLETFAVSPDGKFLAFAGNHGYIILVSLSTKQWVANLKANGAVRSVVFSPDSTVLFSTGDEGQVYLWDVSSRRCIRKFADDGVVHGTQVCVSKDGRFLATGSDNGVVNLYSGDIVRTLGDDPKPMKSFMNLTTPVDNIIFNADAQLLAYSSQRKKDSLRIAHVASMTTYKNWPTGSTPLKFVTAVDFSPSSGYLTIGNDAGRVLLYRLAQSGVA